MRWYTLLIYLRVHSVKAWYLAWFPDIGSRSAKSPLDVLVTELRSLVGVDVSNMNIQKLGWTWTPSELVSSCVIIEGFWRKNFVRYCGKLKQLSFVLHWKPKLESGTFGPHIFRIFVGGYPQPPSLLVAETRPIWWNHYILVDLVVHRGCTGWTPVFLRSKSNVCFSCLQISFSSKLHVFVDSKWFQ